MPSALVRHIQGLSDRDIARLHRLAANRPRVRPTVDTSRPCDHAWSRPDCAVAERLRAEE
ncbi:hypothetical protein [Azospirillum soli]|uniref:hypothetical protein n=1 Tax=Azospirillum soli TaxID=1304799 RepID=UPI001AE2CB91|nr:hypothetical protein [Azospirillum soli]MBP2314618.1 hypothetical protein [Azospirillum soli]